MDSVMNPGAPDATMSNNISNPSNFQNAYNGAAEQGKQNVWNRVGNIFTGNSDWNRQMAMQDRENAYNTYMSNTAFQRGAADLKKAGFNPALAATNGASDSSPASGTGTNDAHGGEIFKDLALGRQKSKAELKASMLKSTAMIALAAM